MSQFTEAVVSTPFLGAGKDESKHYVIHFLSHGKPLSSRGLYRLIHSASGTFSYQAIHKTCRQLEKEGAIRETKAGFSLSLDWIKALNAFTRRAEEALGEGYPGLATITEGETRSLVFKKPILVPYWLIREELAQANSGEKAIILKFWSFTWPVLMLGEKEHADVNTVLKKMGIFAIVRDDTATDRLLAEYFIKFGGKAVTGVSGSELCDTIILCNYIINIYWPKEFRKAISKTYKQGTANIPEMLSKLYETCFKEDLKVPVTVFRNAETAEQIREEYLPKLERMAKRGSGR